MHVAVLGAGVTGITTAYYLTELGHSVTVIDGAAEVASGASGRNGGQLSYSFTDAFASPALLNKLPGQFLGLDTAIRIRPAINKSLMRWGTAFLGQCTHEKLRLNTVAVLKLAMESSKLLREIRKTIPMEFSFRQAGKLVMIENRGELESARKSQLLKKEQGCHTDILSAEQAFEIEPALREFKQEYIGAVWSKHDEVGCPGKFCQALMRWLQENRGVDLRLNETIESIETYNARLKEIITSKDSLQPDAVVVCLGAHSAGLLESIGIKANIYPIRGYSVTLPLGAAPIETSVTDLGNKIVFSRLDDQIRIAGLADIVGFSSKRDSQRLRDLVEIAHSLAPEVADFNAKPDLGWAAYRPMTPDSRPLVGSSSIEGVFLNTGHGMLGWTLACATGNQVAKQLHIKMSV